ncbi:MAG: Gfo/Idh/MocA family protein [Sedimentisphaerales bacterium]
MKTIKFGIIGCGLMGREFASAVARWCHLSDMDVKPEIVAICDASEKIMEWYTQNFSTIKQTTKNYKELLANKEVEAVYIAVPHNLHAEFYCAAIEAGKHLFGEKPFGIDKAANDKILATIKKHPEVFVRCSSESPFFPAVQRIGDMIEADAFGTILEVHSGFLHSSDLDVNKPINWKRMIEFNGEYGCMGDLGMHACHMPFKAGWLPINVRAQLSKIVKERPDGKGGKAPCKTWDNATLFCQAKDSKTGWTFPLTIKTHRIAPGNKNNWYLEIWGTKACARWSSKQINTLEVLEYKDGRQSWQNIDMGQEVAYKSITGGIFQMGFSDSILQMWAAFCYELIHGKSPKKFAGCVTPDEVSLSHRLFTAALESHRNNAVVSV